MRVQCSQRKHQNQENDIEEEKVRLSQQLAEEKRAHAEIENYLKKHVEVRIIIHPLPLNGCANVTL